MRRWHVAAAARPCGWRVVSGRSWNALRCPQAFAIGCSRAAGRSSERCHRHQGSIGHACRMASPGYGPAIRWRDDSAAWPSRRTCRPGFGRRTARWIWCGDRVVVGCLLLTGWTDASRRARGRAARRGAAVFAARDLGRSEALLADLEGLERLFGDPRTLGESLRGSLADRGLHVHLALAPTCTTARLVAAARAGLSVVLPADQAATLSALPIDLLKTLASPKTAAGATPSDRPPARFYRMSPVSDILRARRRARTAVKDRDAHDGITPERLQTFRRWGLRTLGDLAALPAADLAARLGADGPRLQALARGEDAGPLVPLVPEERFEATLALEWPIDGLEPLSFVLGRLADPLAAHLDRRGRAASVLYVDLRLVTRESLAAAAGAALAHQGRAHLPHAGAAGSRVTSAAGGHRRRHAACGIPRRRRRCNTRCSSAPGRRRKRSRRSSRASRR